VTIEGFFFTDFSGGELKDAFVSEQFADPSKGIEPSDPFARVRIEFRPDAIPNELQTRWAKVSGVFGLRRVERDGRIVALFNLADAVEGARRPPPVRATAERLTFALLETCRASARGDDLETRPYDVKDIGPMPEALATFQDRWVTMAGNLFVPFPAERIEKFILAKNPWDGCCFGVPPAPWNSMLVKLKEEKTLEMPYPSLMTVSGRFHFEVQRDARTGLVTHCFELRDAVIGAEPEPGAGGWGAGVVSVAVGIALVAAVMKLWLSHRN
jgi:hypothetical protein